MALRSARMSRPLLPSALLALCVLLACIPAALADMTHDHPAPVPPSSGDARFMAGTVGPVVFRGTAVTVTVPDGPGFGGEVGRTQNSGDLRKNNYSVTDANFNNVLGLLPANPDTGAPLTYVQHIQLYAAAGFIEAFAPDIYAHMIMHQNRGEGTVLGAAGYLMGLVDRYDAAAHGLSASQIPATLPGTSMSSRAYVRATRDATGQQWARMHHAQTAPMVYRMLVDAGVTSSAALVLASDDGISGAGRLNGMNEQDGSKDGFNSGERATWAFAAQLQAQTGIPIVLHLMHGHDHAGIDASALTKPKINPLLGLDPLDRSASDARAAAIAAGLQDGRIATSATAAADQNLTVRNTMFLQPLTSLDVDVDMQAPSVLLVGTQRTMTVKVTNNGPHVAQDVVLDLAPSGGQQVTSIAAPAGAHCMGTSMCHLGDVSSETNKTRTFTLTVRTTAAGIARLRARISTASPSRGDLDEERSATVYAPTKVTLGIAARAFGLSIRSCGASLLRPCPAMRGRSFAVVATVSPSKQGTSVTKRSIRSVVQRKVGKRWLTVVRASSKTDTAGRARVTLPAKYAKRGAYRVQISVDAQSQLRSAVSPWRYVAVR